MKTDKELQQDMMAELKWEPSIDAAEIGVGVKEGIVTLSGNVDTWGEKWDAFQAKTRHNRKDLGLLADLERETGGLSVGKEVRIKIAVEVLRKNAMSKR